jgi:hypothetical protein
MTSLRPPFRAATSPSTVLCGRRTTSFDPCEPLPPSPVLERRFTLGRAFEAEITARLLELHPKATVLTGDTPEEREVATVEAANGAGERTVSARSG